MLLLLLARATPSVFPKAYRCESPCAKVAETLRPAQRESLVLGYCARRNGVLKGLPHKSITARILVLDGLTNSSLGYVGFSNPFYAPMAVSGFIF